MGALARDHESWSCGESRNARFEPSPCRSGFRLRLARRQVAASALRAFAARQDTNAAYAAHEYAPSGLHECWATFCYNCRHMNKGLICPDECYAIRGAIYEVHNEMGSGFREEVYQQCLEREFDHRGIPFDAKKELRICYKGVPIEKTYIPDFFCYGKIIVEIKAVSELTKEHRAQLLNYLRLTKCKMGLLVNFASYPKATVEQWAQ